MDDKRLQEIEYRAAKATPGPWIQWSAKSLNAWGIYHPRKGSEPVSDICGTWSSSGPEDIETSPNGEANTYFIAASRQDIPDLLAEVKRLRELLRGILEDDEQEHDHPERLKRIKEVLNV